MQSTPLCGFGSGTMLSKTVTETSMVSPGWARFGWSILTNLQCAIRTIKKRQDILLLRFIQMRQKCVIMFENNLYKVIINVNNKIVFVIIFVGAAILVRPDYMSRSAIQKIKPERRVAEFR